MFAKGIVLSDAFLDMPLGARCLYLTYGMLADDDGFINNPKSIIRQCGATEDDLKILLTKKFVLGFPSGVVCIKHWKINNYIQRDRYTPTKYIREKSMIWLDEYGIYHFTDKAKELPSAKDVYTQDRENPNPMYTQYRLGKDRIGKDKDSISDNFHNKTEPYSLLVADGNFSAEKEAMRRIVEAWNGTGLTKVKSFSLDSRRGKAMTARVNENGIEAVLEAIGKIRDCRFFHGENKRGWVATLDWLLDVDNFQKVSEGQYDAQFAAPDSAKSGGDWLLDKIARGDFDE